MSILSILSLLAISNVLVSSSPVPSTDRSLRVRRTAFQPRAEAQSSSTPLILLDISLPLTYPTAGVVFTAGGAGYATWNATLPAGYTPASNQVAQTANLVLGYSTGAGLHLNLLSAPLVSNISLFTAPYRVDFTFPANLSTMNNYIFALEGSSGNDSPKFTILSVADAALSSSSAAPNYSTSTYQSFTSTTATPTDSSTAALVETLPTTTSIPPVTTTTPLPPSPVAPVVVTSTAAAVTILSSLPTSSSAPSPTSNSASVAVTSGAIQVLSNWAGVFVAGLVVLEVLL